MDECTLQDETLGVIGGYGRRTAEASGSFAPPLCQTVSFPLASGEDARRMYDPADEFTGHTYTRRSNPTNEIFEKRIALLEKGEAGLATSSGMAAIFAATAFFLEHGAECVVSNRVYTRSFQLLAETFAKSGMTPRVVEDPTDLSAWEAHLGPKTRFMFVETPSNPALVISDLSALAEMGRARDIPLIVDNTLATPVATKPLALGAAVVIESASKYIAGNGTALLGVLAARREWVDRMRRTDYVQYGYTAAPFNSWLGLLGLETLSIRMEKHSRNALTLAAFLERHPRIEAVNYPGLASHPQHDLAKRQMNGIYGGLMSFTIKDATRDKVFTFLDTLHVITHAIHESASRSIVCNPASTNFADLSPEGLAKAGIAQGLIRFSVGLENENDLLNDLDLALAKI